MRSNPIRFEIRDSNGAVDLDALADLRAPNCSVRPQFEKDGRLWLVVRKERSSSRIAVRDSETLVPVSGFDPPAELPQPPFALSPAADGRIWVLGRQFHPGVSTSPYRSPQSHSLYRLNPDGSLDATFPPEELTPQNLYQMEQSEGPGLVLSRTWPGRILFWPGPSERVRTFEFRDEDGVRTKTSVLRTPLGIQPEYLIAAGEVLSYNRGFAEVIQVGDPDPVTRATLDLAQMPPLTTTLDLLPGGDLLVGGTRRFRSDGTPETHRHAARFEGKTTVERLIPLRNGEVLATGDFDLVSGAPTDPSFPTSPRPSTCAAPSGWRKRPTGISWS